MYARMATFSVNDASEYAEIAEQIRQAVQPIIEALPGWQGATQMLDRENGSIAILHLFDSEENMQAAEQTFETMPERVPDELGERMRAIAGGRQSVQRFEVLGDIRR